MRDKLNQLFKSEKSQCNSNSTDSIGKGKKQEKSISTNQRERMKKKT